MTHKIDHFASKLLELKPEHVKLHFLGGRYVEMDGKKLTFNKLVKILVNENLEQSLKVLCVKKIKKLDEIHPEYGASIFVRILTAIRQLFGNFSYHRKEELRKLKTQVVKPSLRAVRAETPPSTQVRAPPTPEKLGSIVPRVRRDSSASRLSPIEKRVYRDIPFDDLLSVYDQKRLFPPDKTLLDFIFSVNEIRDDEKFRIVPKIMAKTDLTEWREIINRPLSVKALKDALIYGKNIEKTVLIENCLPHLEPVSFNLVLKGYLDGLKKLEKGIERNDATLERFIKYYASLYPNKKNLGDQIDKSTVILAIQTLIPVDTIGLNWLQEPLGVLRKNQVLTDEDVNCLMQTYQNHHPGYSTDPVFAFLSGCLQNSIG